MDDLWVSLPIGPIGIGVLVTAAVLSIYRGWWVPARTVAELMRVRDERIKELAAERDDWKGVAHAKDETMREQGTQVGELLELAKTGNALMNALTELAKKGSS